MNSFLAPGLCSPHCGLSSGAVIATAFVLGVVHVSPDERIWPITFSWHASRPHGGARQVRRRAAACDRQSQENAANEQH